MILGFDASTTTVGYAFCNNSIIKSSGFIDISKQDSNKDKAFHVINHLKTDECLSQITRINLEAALSGFMGGRTRQQTIIKLARFNAVFEYIISEQWKCPVHLISVTTARKQVFGKCREKGLDSKLFVARELERIMPNLHTLDKKNKKGEFDVHNYDMYDAIVMSKFQ